MKKKVVVVIPVHCVPKVAMMTLGTWLEACDGSYEAEIILGVHGNYHHYHDGLWQLRGLPVRISEVQEMNWNCDSKEDSLLRYSKMHSISLKGMFEMAGDIGFDHLAVLDHDLVFKSDFVGWSMSQPEDLTGCYLSDRTEYIPVQTSLGMMMFAPKFSIWHMVMTSRFYQKMMEDVGLVFPQISGGSFYDTFSRVIEKNNLSWKLPMKEMKSGDVDGMVKHLWSMSFNFGPYTVGNNEYCNRLIKCENDFDERYPNGIGHLFERVGL